MIARFGTAAAALAFALLVAMAGPATAASLTVSPSTVAAGGSVTVSGNCEPNTSGFALSTAFLHDASHDFAGVGAVSFTTDASGNFSATATIPTSRAPGHYTVTARCGGGNLGVQAPLTVTRGALPFTGGRPFGLLSVGVGALVAGGLLLVVAGQPRLRRSRA